MREQEIGKRGITIGEHVRRLTRALLRRLQATLMFLGYPLRWLIYTVVTKPIVMGQAARIALPLSYGLPGDEFLAGDIVVKQNLEIPQIRTRTLDVSRDLLTTASDVEVDKKRFEFLWDDKVLKDRYDKSIMAQHFGREPSPESKRHLLAIKERMREFFGVAGFRHSLYYENNKVIEEVGDYLRQNAARY